MLTKFHYCHIMLLCCCYKVYKEDIKTTALAKGLTITVSISPQYLTAVRVLLVMTWNFPPTQGLSLLRSSQMMLQAAKYSPQHLQTLSHMSHAPSMNLLSSVNRTECVCLACQLRCSLENANGGARRWAVNTGPTRGHRTLKPTL